MSEGSVSPGRPVRRRLFGIATSVLTVLLIALLAEAGARGYASVSGRVRGVVFDPELGWRLRAAVAKVGICWGDKRPARTNSRGWRDTEHAFEKPRGVRRLVAIGDSFTFGMPVDDGERFTDLLAKGLEGTEVINLGVLAYGTDQELRVLETEGFRYEPDVVVLVVFLGNDLDDIGCDWLSSRPKPYYLLSDGALVPVEPKLTWDVWIRELSYCADVLYHKAIRRYDARRAPAWEGRDTMPLFEALVKRIADGCTAHGARMLAVLAYPPDICKREPNETETRARAVLENAGITTLDTFPAIAEAIRAGETVYSDDGIHWNARGHEIVAGLVGGALRAGTD